MGLAVVLAGPFVVLILIGIVSSIWRGIKGAQASQQRVQKDAERCGGLH